MYTITKEFHFSASHQLCGLGADHPCARLHGHNYIAVVELTAEKLDDTGFVIDYRALSPFKNYIDHALDHRHLNEVFGHNQVTSEWLAKFLFDWCKARWPQTVAVKISETPKTWAEYRP